MIHGALRDIASHSRCRLRPVGEALTWTPATGGSVTHLPQCVWTVPDRRRGIPSLRGETNAGSSARVAAHSAVATSGTA